jgi:hypothetical protein
MKAKELLLLLAEILNAGELQPHHIGAIKEVLNYPTDEELSKIILTGELKESEK